MANMRLTHLVCTRIIVVLLICTVRSHGSTKPRILVVGGSGRVGGSAVCSLIRSNRCSIVDVGGRELRNWEAYKRGRADDVLTSVKFQPLNLFDDEACGRLIPSYDLVINTAGPFQGLDTPALMESCLRRGVAYVDVCDDISLSRTARGQQYQQLAQTHCTSAVISAGIWPGVSSLLAEELLANVGDEAASCRFSFFTAGSGGAGETILTATFLLLGENVLTYEQGRQKFYKTATDGITVDFGPGVGLRDVVRLNLIECESCFVANAARLPDLSVETRFGTAPAFWNRLFALMALVMPQPLLQNRAAMKTLAAVSLPMVRLVDMFVGKTNGIHVEVTRRDGSMVSSLLTHADLESEVGECLADFGMALLEGRGSFAHHGVFFPEEIPSPEYKARILEASKRRSMTFVSTEM